MPIYRWHLEIAVNKSGYLARMGRRSVNMLCCPEIGMFLDGVIAGEEEGEGEDANPNPNAERRSISCVVEGWRARPESPEFTVSLSVLGSHHLHHCGDSGPLEILCGPGWSWEDAED